MICKFCGTNTDRCVGNNRITGNKVFVCEQCQNKYPKTVHDEVRIR